MRRHLLLAAVLATLFATLSALAAAPASASIGPPVLVGVIPPSPGASTTPTFFGLGGTTEIVKLYGSATCTGPVLGTGVVAGDNSWVASISVAPGSTTDVHATETSGDVVSSCSTTHVVYTATVPPDTAIAKHPKATVKTSGRKAEVSFSFTSTVSPPLFVCTLDGVQQGCSAKQTFSVKKGSHTLSVTAFDTATWAHDPTPATYAFTVKKKAAR